MNALHRAILLTALAASLAGLACGRYGPPRRAHEIPPPAAAPASSPVPVPEEGAPAPDQEP